MSLLFSKIVFAVIRALASFQLFLHQAQSNGLACSGNF